jgi:hypothetical protein
MDGNIVSDEALLDWIATPHQALTWQNSGKELPVTHIATEDIAAHFGFTQHPRQT